MNEDFQNKNHKAGFVSIVGKPNAGKSTLMNVLVGEKLSIVTSKAQTTRHRILGIVNSDDFQIIYSDTPGIIKASYQLQEHMMSFVSSTLVDSDVVLLVIDMKDPYSEDSTIDRLKNSQSPVVVVLNKVDLVTPEELEQHIKFWQELINPTRIIPVSALKQINITTVFDTILEFLPLHPPFYDKETLTDRPERFFAAEVVREKIFKNYKKEVPYSTEVVITEFKETETIIRMRAEIYVERQTQKGIIIGKNGEALKKIGIQAREDLEKFFEKQVYLETFVKVEADWRKRESVLRKFGYKQD
jgi:GTP-binding protein Era